ncbi:MAG: hypothetical protein U1F16_01995 [Turneriella sp.]
MTTIVILFVFAPIILYASTLPLRLVAAIVGRQIGLGAFAFAAPVTLLLTFVFVRILFEIRDQLLHLFPVLSIGQTAQVPSLLLAVAISGCLMAAPTWFWWHDAFPPGTLLIQGKAVTMRIAQQTQAATGDGVVSFHSQQIWLEHITEESAAAYPQGKRFALLAPESIDEDADPKKLQKFAPMYARGRQLNVWTIDPAQGPFFERRYSARAFAALLWWYSAALTVAGTVVYLRLAARYPRQKQAWQQRLERFFR